MALGHFTKLGPAPFVFTDMIGPEDCHFAGMGDPFEGVEGSTEKCECCGKKISWRCVITDANDKPHVVGRTCASTATDLVGVSLRDAELKAKRAIVRTWMSEEGGKEFREWCSKQEHPKGWKNKSLFSDLQYWCGRGNEKGLPKLRKALKAFGKGDAAELLEAEKKAEAHRLAKKKQRAAGWIRSDLKYRLQEEKQSDPWEIADEFGSDWPEETKAKYEAHLREKHGERRDWEAEEAKIDALTDDEAWADAEKRGRIVRGSYQH